MNDVINPIASGDLSLLFRNFLLFKLGTFREYISPMFIANTRTDCNYFASSFMRYILYRYQRIKSHVIELIQCNILLFSVEEREQKYIQ